MFDLSESSSRYLHDYLDICMIYILHKSYIFSIKWKSIVFGVTVDIYQIDPSFMIYLDE